MTVLAVAVEARSLRHIHRTLTQSCGSCQAAIYSTAGAQPLSVDGKRSRRAGPAQPTISCWTGPAACTTAAAAGTHAGSTTTTAATAADGSNRADWRRCVSSAKTAAQPLSVGNTGVAATGLGFGGGAAPPVSNAAAGFEQHPAAALLAGNAGVNARPQPISASDSGGVHPGSQLPQAA